MVSAQNLVLELLLWKYRKNLFATAALTAAWFLAKEGIKRYTQAQAGKICRAPGFRVRRSSCLDPAQDLRRVSEADLGSHRRNGP